MRRKKEEGRNGKDKERVGEMGKEEDLEMGEDGVED